MDNKYTAELAFDKHHIWHPYTSMTKPLPSYYVESAQGVTLQLANNQQVIDGMSSWWAAIHGYNHPTLNQAIVQQTKQMAHVMFGGLTHQPAIDLCKTLINITPDSLNKVFLADSGSVAVEVAMKMAIQYWHSKGLTNKSRFLTVKHGYHGDTFAAMSVCDPVNGMHQLFEQSISKQLFAPAPATRFEQQWQAEELNHVEKLFAEHHQDIAAFIIEPIVQGAGGMRIYHPEYLAGIKALCKQYQVLLIADEIATGFGRTGKLFACEWANITPDIMCLGKALTGGYMSLAATLCSDDIAHTISQGQASCFMHGPTFMGNPLACAVANASLTLLLEDNWQQKVATIEHQFKQQLLPLRKHNRVADVRVLGAIGVVEVNQPVDMEKIQAFFVNQGVWIRPFGKLIYLMPPYIINSSQLATLINAIAASLDSDSLFKN